MNKDCKHLMKCINFDREKRKTEPVFYVCNFFKERYGPNAFVLECKDNNCPLLHPNVVKLIDSVPEKR